MKADFAAINVQKYTEGAQRITQRLDKCNCGCHGQDPWHAQHIKRVIRDTTLFDCPHHAKSGWAGGGLVNICATGTYKHPSGIRQCGLVISRVPDSLTTFKWHIAGWQWIDDDTPVRQGTREEQQHEVL